MRSLLNFEDIVMNQSVARSYALKVIDGVTLVFEEYASESERNINDVDRHPIIYNPFGKKNEIVAEVMEICSFIESLSLEPDADASSYETDAVECAIRDMTIRTRFNELSRGPSCLEVQYEGLSDDSCWFFRRTSDKERLTQMAYSFICKYGVPGIYRNSQYRNEIRLFDSSLREAGRIAEVHTITPIGVMLGELYDIYLRFNSPSIRNKIAEHDAKRAIDQRLIPDPTIISTITIRNSFRDGVGWETYCLIDTMLEAIKLMLVSFIGNRSEIIGQCSYCNKFFVSKNEKAIYCSPVCRNRANVKKSYEKKKARKKTTMKQ